MNITASPPSASPSPVAYSGDALFARQSGRRLRLGNPEYSRRWNWGAFFFSWFWLLHHGRPRLAIAFFLLDGIPIIGLVAHIYCGLKGNDLAYDGRSFASVAQFDAVQRAWRNWGFAIVTFLCGTMFATAGAHVLHNVKSMLAFAQPGATPKVHAAVVRRPQHPMLASVELVRTQFVARRAPVATAAPVIPAAAPVSPAPRAAVAASDPHPCESALDFVDAALAATADREKYDKSVSALKLAGACHKSALALRARSLALSEKAIAEHHGRFGDWRKDIGDSIRASSLCLAQRGDLDGDNADCHDMVDHETQIAIIWEVEKN